MGANNERASGNEGHSTERASLAQIAAIYHALIEWMPQRVFFKDLQSVFVSVNATFARDLGLTPADLIGKSDFDLFPRELARKYQADDRRVMERRTAETLEEANVIGGRQRVVEVVKTPVQDHQGQVLGLLGVFTDITERKQAERQLKEYASQMERRNRELQDFAYIASHDLQEPLRKVAVFGSRLQTKCQEALGAEGKDYLDRMLKATARMQVLIEDLLSFTRVSTHAKPFAKVDLSQIVQEVLTDLETRLEQCQGRVDVGSLPTLRADPTQMRQLFQNLIGNALKFGRPGAAPLVTIRAEEVAGEPGAGSSGGGESPGWIVTVSDNGIGFENQYADRIFHVFQRLHSRNEYAGSGIGLAICRKIVERHGGEIAGHGIPGEGATFTFRLPKHSNLEPATHEA